MALTCPAEFDVATLDREIQTMYGESRLRQMWSFTFTEGPVAVSRLGYDHDGLPTSPSTSPRRLPGRNPHAIARST